MMDRDEFLQLQEGDEFIVSEDAEVESDHQNESILCSLDEAVLWRCSSVG